MTTVAVFPTNFPTQSAGALGRSSRHEAWGGCPSGESSVVRGGASGSRQLAQQVGDLLDTGVDVDARPYRNTTAQHFAIQFRRHDMVRHLLDRGASTTIEDDTYQSDAAGWAQACDDGSEAAIAIRELIGTT